jgi:hypothetical protein
MRVNIETDEHIIASLPKVWENELGFMGFFNKSKEGILVLTNKKFIFVPQYVLITPKEREKYFGEDEAKVTRIDNYSESQLDEDISAHPNSLIVPLESIVDVESVKLRKVNFLRIRFKTNNSKTKTYDFGITKSVTNYPIRQPLIFYSIDWTTWVRTIKAYL